MKAITLEIIANAKAEAIRIISAMGPISREDIIEDLYEGYTSTRELAEEAVDSLLKDTRIVKVYDEEEVGKDRAYVLK